MPGLPAELLALKLQAGICVCRIRGTPPPDPELLRRLRPPLERDFVPLGPVKRSGTVAALLEMPSMPSALCPAGMAFGGQLVDRARGDALDTGFPDHRRQRLFRHAARFEEAGKVTALPRLRDLRLDGPGARVPVAVAVVFALGEPVRRLLALARAG
jgi:hypothetical protein